MAQVNQEQVTAEDFKIMLEEHDWWYMMSDDSRIYEDGLASEKELRRIAATNPDFQVLLDERANKEFKPI